MFSNFDADRAAAGFPILGELTRSPQALGFTRHEHRVEIARNVLGQGDPGQLPGGGVIVRTRRMT